MLNQYHCKSNNFKFQPELSKWIRFIQPLYNKFVPFRIRHRRNVTQSKLNDVVVISLLCWQVSLDVTNQFRFYSFLKNNVFKSRQFPERSRFNRICRNALSSLQYIRIGLSENYFQNPAYLIMDSLPLPVCVPVRNKRAKVFRQIADIGYNAAKKQYYYGFKGHFEIDNNGIIRAYAITKASKTDTALVRTLLSGYRCSKVLADKGYLKKELKEELNREGIWFWTPIRKNMEPQEDEKMTKDLKRKRKYIETIFSGWVNLFDIERIRVKSLKGFQLRLEQCFLVYTVQLLEIN